MHKLYCRVGEHVLGFQSDSPVVMGWIQEKFCIVARPQLNQDPDLVIAIEDGYGEAFQGFDVHIYTDATATIYERVDYKVRVDSRYETAHISVYDMYALKHALMNLYSAFIVHRQWGLLIHSSCVIEGGSAYVFSGRSGAGKSTIARLSQPRSLLSDEATIVKVSSDGVVVYDSPFRSETQPEFYDRGFPLAAIHLIHQSPIVSRVRTESTQGIVQLMDKVFFWAHDSEQTKTILRMYHSLAGRVPIYDLHFQKNDTFWEAIS